MKSTLYCLQAAYTHLQARGGSIVVVGPSLSLAGALLPVKGAKPLPSSD